MTIFLLTILTCSQITSLYNRIINNMNLTEVQKQEIIKEVTKVVPFCPVLIKK
jgi:hypothetical protein